VLTLQFGRASNFAGAHFWNVQDELLEIDRDEYFTEGNDANNGSNASALVKSDSRMDANGWVESNDDANGGGRAASQINREFRPEILYRVSEHAATPRLVAVDFRRGVGALKPLSSLTSSAPRDIFALDDETLAKQSHAVWDGAVQVSRETPVQQNAFLQWLEQSASSVEGVALGNSSHGAYDPYDAYGGHVQNVDDYDNSYGQQQQQYQQAKADNNDEDLYESKRVHDKDVKSWGDFLKAQVHEKSVCLLHRHGDADFEAYTSGHETVLQRDQLEHIHEMVRFYLEECDRLQGVHALVDVNTGFGSIAQTVLQDIREEARSAAIWCLGVVEPNKRKPSDEKYNAAMRKRALNEAVALSSLSRICHLYTPVPLYTLQDDASRLGALPYISKENFDASSLFHSTSFIGAALDAASTPYRLVQTPNGPHGAATLGELCARVGPSEDNRIAGFHMSMPFPHPRIDPVQLSELLANSGALQEAKHPFGVDLSSTIPLTTPNTPVRSSHKIYGASVVLRGNHPARTDPIRRRELTSSLGNYLERTKFSLTPVPLYCTAATPMPITLAHPNIFRNQLLGSAGEISVGGNAPPVTMPSLISLASSTRLATNIAAAQSSLRAPGLALQLEFAKGPAGLGNDEFNAMREDLDNNIGPAYGIEGSGSSDDEADLDN